MNQQYIFKVGDKGLTRDGRPYEVVAVLDRSKFADISYPVIASVDGSKEEFTLTGSYLNDEDSENDEDLMQPAVVRYVNFYPNGRAYHYESAGSARATAARGAIGVAVPVEIKA